MTSQLHPARHQETPACINLGTVMQSASVQSEAVASHEISHYVTEVCKTGALNYTELVL